MTCLLDIVPEGQQNPPVSTGLQDIDDVFFDMSWLEDEEDWLSLKHEAAHISDNTGHSDLVLQGAQSLPQVTPSLISRVEKGCHIFQARLPGLPANLFDFSQLYVFWYEHQREPTPVGKLSNEQ